MPRNVRNFWIEAEVDGRKTPIAFGPGGKDGGFSLTVYMRNQGGVERVAGMEGACFKDGELTLWVEYAGEEGRKGTHICRKR